MEEQLYYYEFEDKQNNFHWILTHTDQFCRLQIKILWNEFGNVSAHEKVDRLVAEYGFDFVQMEVWTVCDTEGETMFYGS